MRKLACTVLLFSLLMPMFAVVSDVHAATPVIGVINSDTVWRTSGSPYQLTGPVCIASGVTLTIEPRVTVDFGEYYILVNGTLCAHGSEDNKILFTGYNPQDYSTAQIQFTKSSVSWNNQTQKGCILQNILFDGSMISAKDGCSPVIAGNVFRNQKYVIILASTAAPTITGNIFENINYEGVSAGQSSIVTNNLFNKTTWQATAIVGHDKAYIANNQILGFYYGINGGATIEGNVVIDCTTAGIKGGQDIKHNYVAENKIGIESGGTIEDNTIVNNEVGINAYAATIKNNNIIGNGKSVVANTSSNINAANNWWGTTRTDEIKQSVWDYDDDFNLGSVTFEPILTQPNMQAPTSDSIAETLSSIGASSVNYFDYQMETDILATVTWIIAALAVGWAIIVTVFFVRRLKKRKRLPVNY